MSFDKNLLPDAITYFQSQGHALTRPSSNGWSTTNCNFHGGNDSMRVNTKSGHWICMNCATKGGDILSFHMQTHDMEFIEAAKSLGAWVEDGRKIDYKKPVLPLRAALQAMALESHIIIICALNMANGVSLSKRDLESLKIAAKRISIVSEAVK